MSYGRITGSDVKAVFIEADTDALDADGICASQTSGATAGTLTINGAKASGGVATLNSARQITLASAANLADKTFTITGTDANGDALTESLTGPNNSTVTSTKHFLTVTEIAFTDGTSGTMTAGFNTSAIAVVFAGRTRLKGAFIVNSATGGIVSFRDSADAGESGTTLLQLGTVASATAERDVTIPGEGVLFDNGVFIPYTAGTTVFTNMTVFRS
jgi:VCBS repeat-containing protein